MFNTKVYKDLGGDRLVVASGGELVIQNGAALSIAAQQLNAIGNGAVAGTGVSVVEKTPVLHESIFTFTDVSITMTDAGAAGCHGSQKIYDFPAGNIAVLGVVSDLQIVAGAGGIGDTAAVVGSIGSAAIGTDNATLTTTEANLMPSTAATLTGGAGNLDGESTAVTVLDGTATAIDAYLNLAVPDAGSSASDTLTVNGTVRITWANIGDN